MPTAIRYYERIGLMPAPKRARNGYRSYSDADVTRLVFIVRARELDFDLPSIKEILAFRDDGEIPCPYVITKIARKVADLEREISRMTRLKFRLTHLQREAVSARAEAIETTDCVCQLIERSPVSSVVERPEL